MAKVNRKVRLRHVGHSLSYSSLCAVGAFLGPDSNWDQDQVYKLR